MKAVSVLLFALCFSSVVASTLTVGTLSTNPPFEMQATDDKSSQTFTGFDISIVEEICKEMHATCQFKSVNFHDIEKSLDNGIIDIAVAAIIITPERRNQYGFSMPYLPSYLQFVTLKDNPAKSLDDLKGKKLGVYLNSPAKQWLISKYGRDVQTKSFKHSEQLFNSLVKGEVDAVVTNYEGAIYWTNQISHDFRFIGDKFAIGQGYGIMTKKDNQFLIDKMNKALQTIEKNGVYLEIYQNTLAQ